MSVPPCGKGDQDRAACGVPFGTLVAEGDFSVVNDEEGGQLLVVGKDFGLSYQIDRSRIKAAQTDWHLEVDESRQIDDFSIDANIGYGAVVVQSSVDGTTWYTRSFQTDVFAEGKGDLVNLFTPDGMHLYNSWWHRIVVVYRLEKLVGTHYGLFNVLEEENEYLEFAEVYKFRLIGDESYLAADNPQGSTARQQIGETRRTDNVGYVNERTVPHDDPHFGWELGRFYVCGFAASDVDNAGKPVFYKTVGNQLSLQFELFQDINALPGENSPSISRDQDGIDEAFEVQKTDFGRGALIIREHKNDSGKGSPTIYTNFLEAYTSPFADTRVLLNEESDYNVALDYEIQRGGFGPFPPEYFNYRISFSFSVTNGNSMAFLLDVVTRSELADGAYTENGFYIDRANSQNLTITISRSILVDNDNGTFRLDTRGNIPSAEGEKYTESGIYEIDIQGEFSATGTTHKTIYVGGPGGDENLKLMSQNGWSVDELNEYLTGEKN